MIVSDKIIILLSLIFLSLIMELQSTETNSNKFKETWLTCRIDFKVANNYFINFATYSNGDMMLMASTIPDSYNREFYGLKKNGRYFFDSVNQIVNVSSYREQSTLTTIQISNSEKEYLLSISKGKKQTELFDLENSEYNSISSENFAGLGVSGFLNSILKMSSSNSNSKLYFFAFQTFINLKVRESCLVFKKYKFNTATLNGGYQIIKNLTISNKRRSVSCFETKNEVIGCFIVSINKYHSVEIFNQNLDHNQSINLENITTSDEEEVFMKAIHLKDEIAIFSFYDNYNKTDAPSTLIKKIDIVDSKYQLSDYISDVTKVKCDCEGYSHHYDLNDLVKISDTKFCLMSVSNTSEELKVSLFVLYNSDQKINIRYYKTNFNSKYGIKFATSLKVSLYNQFLSLASCFCSETDCVTKFTTTFHWTSLIIFSYPNSTDIDIDVIKELYNDNIKNTINNYTISNLSDYITIENNMFTYEFYGIKIQKIPNEITIKNTTNQMNEGDILVNNETLFISFNNDNISKNKYIIEFAGVVTEPDYWKIITYTTQNCTSFCNTSEENYFTKELYIGKTSYLTLNINYELTKDCQKNKCNLCTINNSNGDFCVTCKYKFEFDYTKTEYNTKECEILIEEEGEEYEENEEYEELTENYEKYEKEEKLEKLENVEYEENEEYEEFSEKYEKEEKFEKLEKLENVYEEYEEYEEFSEKYEKEEKEEKLEKLENVYEKYEEEKEFIKIKEEEFEEKIEKVKELEQIEIEEIIIKENNGKKPEEECTTSEILNNECTDRKMTNDQVTEVYDIIKEDYLKNYTNESTTVITQNVVFQISTVKDQQSNDGLNISTIDLGECEALLKKKYDIPEDEELIIFKTDTKSEDGSATYVQYEIYNPYTLEQLSLDICKQTSITVSVPIQLDEDTTSIYNNAADNGYDLFNLESDFYNDLCTPYTTENGTDLSLSDRKELITNATATFCQTGCNFKSYNQTTSKANCECSPQTNNTETDLTKIDFSGEMIKNTLFNTIKNSNIMIIKCYKLVFSLKGHSQNYGSYLLIIFEYIIIFMYFIFCCRDERKLMHYIDEIIKTKHHYLKLQNQMKKNKNLNNNKKKIPSNHSRANNIDNNYIINSKSNLKTNKNEQNKFNIKKSVPEKANAKPFVKTNIKSNAKPKIIDKKSPKNNIKPIKKISIEKTNIKPNAKPNNKTSAKNNELLKSKDKPQSKKPGSNEKILKGKTTSKTTKKYNEPPKKRINILNKNKSQSLSSISKVNFSSAALKTLKSNKKNNLIPKNEKLINRNTRSGKFTINNGKKVLSQKNINKNGNVVIFCNNFNYKDHNVKKTKENTNTNTNFKTGTIQNIFLYRGLNIEELNTLSYKMAIEKDKRTYCQYYISLIKKKQVIFFTFCPNNDYNLRSVKIVLFIVSFSLYFTVNALFFTDDTMHKVSQDNGSYNIFYRIPQILYSTIISTVINTILKQLSLSEKSILSIKQQANVKVAVDKGNDMKNCLKLKTVIFFFLCILFQSFFWYFITCFCAVYKNTQIILISDTIVSFALSMIYPFGINLVPGFFRIPALRAKKRDKKCLYTLGNLVALI